MKRDLNTVLLLTADRAMANQLGPFLMQNGLSVEQAEDGARGLSRFLDCGFAAIVLDMGLPVVDGLGMLHEIRMRSSDPVIALGGREDECVRGLEGGADDWLLKPCEPAQLLSRLRVLWRLKAKAAPITSGLLRCGGVAVSLQSHEAWLDGEALQLTNVEFAILKCLLRSAGKVVSRDELAAVLYQREATPFERAIDVHISHVRRKLGRSGGVSIRTIRGSGYLLAASVATERVHEEPVEEFRVAQQLAC